MLCVSSKWHVYAIHAQLLAKKICMQKINNFNFSITILRKFATSAFFNFFRFVTSNLQFRIIFNVHYLPPPPTFDRFHINSGKHHFLHDIGRLDKQQGFRFSHFFKQETEFPIFSAYYRNKKQGFRYFILVKKQETGV